MWSFFSRDPVKDFAYEIGEPLNTNVDRIFWKVHKGKKKATGEDASIFILDGKSSGAEIEAGKTGIKRLKTLRHPTILTFMDSVEAEKCTYLATEYAIPLELHLKGKDDLHLDLSVSWGLFQITRGISFLVNDGNLKHNNVQTGSIYVNAAGEWKLGGLEFVVGTESSLYSSKVPSSLAQLEPPELKNGVGRGGTGGTKWSTDAWGLGILIWEVFNGPILSPGSIKTPGKIPKSLQSIYQELTNVNPSSRPNPADIIVRGRRPGGFFKNDLVDSLLFLEEIQIKEQNEKTKFFNGLATVLEKFPDDVCKHKVLPQLINAFEFGNAGSAVLAPMFKLGRLLDEAEYQLKIVPCVVKLFASTDRATRVRLLQQLENIADHLLPGTVNDKIFPNIITGFMDTNPTVREQTVKAMLCLAPKLNHNNINVELLKHFARLQIKDEQGGIRTNTTICLGKISCYLSPSTRRKVLIPAFTRVFQDTFPQAKTAGILALAATQQYYLLSEVSTKILPSLCCLLCDPDKSVRDTAIRTIKGFLAKLEKVSEDPSLREKFEADVDTSTPNTVVDAASTWAGWAVSALTSKFNRSQSQQSALGQIGQASSSGRPKGTRYPLGHSSSSTSTTTTSSIPSSPSESLQPTQEGQESTTDYDDEWDTEDWGSMDNQSNKSGFESSPQSRSRGEGEGKPSRNDGWDTWPIEEAEEKEGDGWTDDSSVPHNNAVGKVDKVYDDFFSSTGGGGSRSSNSYKSTEEWNNQDWNTVDDPGNKSESKSDDLKTRRDERKLQRQRELEAKRGHKTGPMKLGAKKHIDLLDP